uniref:Restriction endonuclease type IV Mrr domain-containing protein n=1 Tax=mine drainage metagenome TaxID=410659 RepID=E6PN09_9ZZZZ
MSRRRTSAFEDLLDIAASLPWPVSLALAAVSYLLLHHLAGLPSVTAKAVNQIGDVVQHTLLTTMASIFQFIIPIAFIIGAVASRFKRLKARRLYDRVRVSPSVETLRQMTWRDFERLVAESYRHQGYAVTVRGGQGADGGVDVELRMGRDLYLVQCKHWKARQVGVATVRELFGVMTAEGAVGGFVVTSGAFTADAEEFARGHGIELVPAQSLLRQIG